jgi:hypothetical protein
LGHLLSSINATAAAELQGHVEPLPRVSDIVLYRPRRSEVKRGRTVMPAMVIWANEDSRTLELFVIAGANDQINQEKVPESPCEGEWGWVRRPESAAPSFVVPDGFELTEGEMQQPGHIQYVPEPVAKLRAELDALREQVWGDNEPAEGNLAEAVMGFEKRLAKFEKQAAKRKPGRPKNSKNKPQAVPAPPVSDAA